MAEVVVVVHLVRAVSCRVPCAPSSSTSGPPPLLACIVLHSHEGTKGPPDDQAPVLNKRGESLFLFFLVTLALMDLDMSPEKSMMCVCSGNSRLKPPSLAGASNLKSVVG